MILIAGANGHVGREIVRKAVDRAVRARCFDLKPVDMPGLDTAALEVVTGDIMDIEAVRTATRDVDTVMCVLGLKRQTKELTHEMVEHGGMQNVVQAAIENNVKHVMYISALGVKPQAPATSLAAKWNAEQALIHSGIPYTIFRPSGYFVDFAEHFAPRIKETGGFTLIGDGQTRLQPLAPADLAEAFIQSIDNEKIKNKIIKIAGPEVFTLADIVHLVGTVVGRQAKVKKLPFWLMNLLFSFMALVTGSRGGKDFLYRMSRDSVCSSEDMQTVRESFTIEFQKLEPWLQQQLKQ